MRAKTASTSKARIYTGNGSLTSPAKYVAAVAADTTEVAEKSKRSTAAPSRASHLEDILSLRAGSQYVLKVEGEADSQVGVWCTTNR